MQNQPKETIEISNEHALVLLRNTIRTRAIALEFSTLEQTKLITAASELARNILLYAKLGKVQIEHIKKNGRNGLQLIFQDQGPGITSIETAMKTGVSSGSGLGLGLPGAKRLVNEFDIKSEPGKGTEIKIILWKHGR